jgi:rare lipoprotein A
MQPFKISFWTRCKVKQRTRNHATFIDIQREKAQAWSGTYGDATMPSLHKLQRHALASVTCALACIAINAAHAEVASVYGGSDGHCGSRTANGESVNCSAMTAAHRTLPFGSLVTVCHRGCVVVRINDRGPFVHGRHIDLTPAAARAIRLNHTGEVSLSR